MKKFILGLFLVVNWVQQDIFAQTKPAFTIAFGSCNRQDLPQPLWKEIIKNKPNVWIWLGDNIYGDTEDMQLMKAKYDQVLANPDYWALTQVTKVMGIWDDHDYGVNDGGVEFPQKEASQQLMFDFLQYPKNTPLRQQKGAYHSQTFTQGGKTIKIILLDARYFRDPIKRVKGVYLPNKKGTILGKAQWKWLKKELTNSTADVHIIGSGIQILPKDHRFEKWANFPKERNKLLKLIAKSKAKNVLLVSGDRHIAEVSKYENSSLNYPLYEMTASGLTHTWSSKWEEPNQYRVEELIIALNFGLFEFYWGEKPSVTIKVKGLENKTLLEHKIDLQK
ncbi:MAG TPA: alkaline phosphatase [Microscillaceae bacterium]|nr:alkaline phosphatase [Microscillaceae bacterium]